MAKTVVLAASESGRRVACIARTPSQERERDPEAAQAFGLCCLWRCKTVNGCGVAKIERMRRRAGNFLAG